MSFLKTNYSEVEQNSGSYGALPTGNYEVVINKVEERQTPNRKESLNFDLIVRNDLTKVPELSETNGKYADRHIFNDNWKRNINGEYDYDKNQFMYYLKAAQIPEGTEIRDLNHLCELLTKKPVRVYVKKEENTYKGETQEVNTVAPWGYSPTKYENVNHQYKDKSSGGQQSNQESNPFDNAPENDIDMNDMPF